MSNFKPQMTEVEMFKQLIEFRLADVHTAMPAHIISYNAVKQTVVVQPDLKRVFKRFNGEEEASSAPILQDVPVYFPRGGGFRITWDLAANDDVLLVFVERSIDLWHQVGGEVDPKPRRKHDWSDAIAFPGLSRLNHLISDVNPGEMVMGAETGDVEISINRLTSNVTIKGATVDLAEAGGPAVSRVGDEVTIDTLSDPAFTAYLAALTPLTVAPYTAPIKARITSGSSKVKSG